MNNFPTSCHFRTSQIFTRSSKIKKCVLLEAKYAKGVAKGFGGKNSSNGQLGLGSRVLNHPPMNVSRLNGMCTLKRKVKPFFTTNRNMP
jgi:hypothetical protein